MTLLLLTPTVAFAEEWTPPENPDPQTILTEAQADARAKRYERALAKQIWIHENSLKHNPAFTGVRLSFALNAWHDLAKDYSPAMDQLIEARNEASNAALDGKKTFESFHTFAAINRTLGDESLTVDTFIQLETQNQDAAKLVYLIAKPALIAAKEYKICNKYLEPDRSYAQMLQMWQINQRLAKKPLRGPALLAFGKNKFTNDTTTLIALLVVNEREAEAKEIAARARKDWNNAAFHQAIDKALTGEVPAVWPKAR